MKGYLLPAKLHSAHEGLSPVHRDRLLRSEDEGTRGLLVGVRDVKEVVVLVCGHGGRDGRCGVFGPVLREEFESQLSSQKYTLLKSPVEIDFYRDDVQQFALREGQGYKGEDRKMGVRVGIISHIGGHKFAGNVIIYLPPGMKTSDGSSNKLAGCGIWYGRVEPRHVEGIVKETVGSGRVIEELFRGGITNGGEVLRL